MAGTIARNFVPERSGWLRTARPPLRRAGVQRSLFEASSGGEAFDSSFRRLERLELGAGAWVDVVQGWLTWHERLFVELRETTDWCAHTRVMYERRVAVPRLTGTPELAGQGRAASRGGVEPRAGALLSDLARALSVRYGRPLLEISLALYRNGADSVAMHGDHLDNVEDAVVAILSLGAPRRFLMKRVRRSTGSVQPVADRDGPAPGSRFRRGADRLVFTPAEGDLLVMGGTCQRTWQHGVPKAARAGERIAVMFR